MEVRRLMCIVRLHIRLRKKLHTLESLLISALTSEIRLTSFLRVYGGFVVRNLLRETLGDGSDVTRLDILHLLQQYYYVPQQKSYHTNNFRIHSEKKCMATFTQHKYKSA